MEQQKKESKEFLSDLTTRDQRMMFAFLTMVHTADTSNRTLWKEILAVYAVKTNIDPDNRWMYPSIDRLDSRNGRIIAPYYLFI